MLLLLPSRMVIAGPWKRERSAECGTCIREARLCFSSLEYRFGETTSRLGYREEKEGGVCEEKVAGLFEGITRSTGAL